MDPAQGTPVRPIEPQSGMPLSQAPKIPIEPGRMQAIKEAFIYYQSKLDEIWVPWRLCKVSVAHELDKTATIALSHRFGCPEIELGIQIINWLEEKGMISEETNAFATFFENNFREQEPEEALQPTEPDLTTKAKRRGLINAAYQEYMDVDPANRENKIAAYNSFVDKVNKQMTQQEVKSIALAYNAFAHIEDFKGLTKWLEGQLENPGPPGLDARCMLEPTKPSTVKRMMDTIFPKEKL